MCSLILYDSDNSIELNYDLQDLIWETLQIQLGFERQTLPEFLVFNSVDIHDLKTQNEKYVVIFLNSTFGS